MQPPNAKMQPPKVDKMCGYVFHYPEHVKPDVPLAFLKQQKRE